MAETKRIFITGIAGFIGYHLAQFLKQRGDFVSGCDNFNTYYDPALKRARADRLQDIEVLEADICYSAMLEDALARHNITHLVHLAAQAGVRHSLQHPEAYVHSNLDGFVQIMELCRRHPHIKCVYASSSSVYGLNQKVPFAESDATERQTSLYGATKKSNELMAQVYHHLYGIHVTGLRYFTVYGPWGRPDMAYYSFTRAIMAGAPIQIYNHGDMQRDFTYIDDIVAGTAAAIDLGAPCEIFNLGNHRPEGVLELVRAIEQATGKSARCEFLPMQPGDVPVTFADISKSQAALSFHPKTPLQEGIGHFVEWYNTKRER